MLTLNQKSRIEGAGLNAQNSFTIFLLLKKKQKTDLCECASAMANSNFSIHFSNARKLFFFVIKSENELCALLPGCPIRRIVSATPDLKQYFIFCHFFVVVIFVSSKFDVNMV